MTRNGTPITRITRAPVAEMNIGSAMRVLAGVWFYGGTPLLVLVIVQILAGRYGMDWQSPFGWLIGLLFPIWSIIGTVMTIKGTKRQKSPVHNRFLFNLTVVLSTGYLVLLYVIDVAAGVSPFGIEETFKLSGWIMTIFQSVLLVLLGKFFIEDIDA